MNLEKILKSDYYLNSSVSFFKSNFEKRLNFLQKKNFLFNEISNFINNCIDNSKSIFIFCAGNSIISKNIKSDKIFIKEIDQKYEIKQLKINLKINFDYFINKFKQTNKV